MAKNNQKFDAPNYIEPLNNEPQKENKNTKKKQIDKKKKTEPPTTKTPAIQTNEISQPIFSAKSTAEKTEMTEEEKQETLATLKEQLEQSEDKPDKTTGTTQAKMHAKHTQQKTFAAKLPKNSKTAIFAIIIFAVVFLAAWQVFFPDLFNIEKQALNQANQKCAQFAAESFCNSKKVEVENQIFTCLWNIKEQKCTVWWTK